MFVRISAFAMTRPIRSQIAALQRMGTPASGDLQAAGKSKNPLVRTGAAKAVGEIQAPGYIQ